ncbi:TPA: hypothetical protein U9I86_001061 [Acinetobacter baumannii]|nr:hypothetical protein [Acinetobacter baumannii]
MITDKDRERIRDYSFQAHCPKVKIFQEKGIVLEGYGTIKINSYGALYIEFICLNKKNIPQFSGSQRFPEDPLDKSQIFYLEAISLQNNKLESKNFDIILDQFSLFKESLYHINLKDISFTTPIISNQDACYFEFNQNIDFPRNKVNKTSSTLGSESISWNEAVINIPEENLNIRIVNEYKDKVFIIIEGDIERDKILDCLTIYLGFCSGTLLQPYYSTYTVKKQITTIIHSVNKIYLNNNYAPILPNRLSEPYNNGEYHYNILKNFIKLYSTNQVFFLSIYAQWKRVWLSYSSIQDIRNLALTTAIEGLLNDIFIPLIKGSLKDEDLDIEINEIKAAIKTLNIDEKYKEKLQHSISYLKNITANKALNYLAEKSIIDFNEVAGWKKLRNEVAHPKIKYLDTLNKYAEKENFYHSLNLFNSLILQTLAYEGPRFYYSSNQCSIQIFDKKELN